MQIKQITVNQSYAAKSTVPLSSNKSPHRGRLVVSVQNTDRGKENPQETISLNKSPK